MSELTEFILARLDEDEATARVCAEAFPPPWDVSDRGHSARVVSDAPNFLPVSEIDQRHESPGRWPGEHLTHIATFDPARVLLEVDAKRRIVALHGFFVELGERECEMCGGQPWPCETLRALAVVWSGHPGFDETWRP